jgi:hypothetical protein
MSCDNPQSCPWRGLRVIAAPFTSLFAWVLVRSLVGLRQLYSGRHPRPRHFELSFGAAAAHRNVEASLATISHRSSRSEPRRPSDGVGRSHQSKPTMTAAPTPTKAAAKGASIARRLYRLAASRPIRGGLFEMHGNAWEWCEDVWRGTHYGAPVTRSADPTGSSRPTIATTNGTRSALTWTSQCPGHAEAQSAAPVVRQVPEAGRRTKVLEKVAPRSAANHAAGNITALQPGATVAILCGRPRP